MTTQQMIDLDCTDSAATVVALGEAALQEARDVAQQIEQRVHDVLGAELFQAG